MSFKVTEIIIPEGWQFKQVINWRSEWSVYNVSLLNSGNNIADMVKIDIKVPGFIFAVQYKWFLGFEIYSQPVIVTIRGMQYFSNPIEIGSLLEYSPVGDDFIVHHGKPNIRVGFENFAPGSTWNMLIYFKKKGIPMPENASVLIDCEWFYSGLKWSCKIKEVEASLYQQWIKFLTNPHSGLDIPYAHADLDPQTPGIQSEKTVKPGEKITLEVIFDFRNSTSPYVNFAISVFCEWEKEPIKRVWKGLIGDRYIHGNIIFNAPLKPGKYGVRVIISDYDYVRSYEAKTKSSRIFQLYINVKPS